MSNQVTNVATALTTNTFTRAGYSFSGWNTIAGGTGTAYANGATYAFTVDATLYAQWSALPNHTVTFDANLGSGSMSNQVTNVATALTTNTFTRAGYSFSGWNTLANGTGTAYANGATYAFTVDATLYAQWIAIPATSFAPMSMWTTNFNYSQEGWRIEKHPRMVADVNGDGKDDVVGFGYAGVWVGLSNGTSFAPISMWTTDYSYNQAWRVELHPRMAGDVNGDGKDDLIGFGYNGVWVALSNGTSFAPISMWTTNFNYSQEGWRIEKHPRMVADVNGDGKADLVGFGYDGVWVALSTGTGFDPITMWTTNFNYSQEGWRVELHPRMTADVNGDGKADLIGFGYNGVWVALSNGTSFAPMSMWTTNFNYSQEGWRIEKHPRMVADVNGDGKADLVGFGYNGVWVAPSNGAGFDPMSMWTTNFNYSQEGWRVELHPRMTGDVNGDGNADLVGFGYNGVWVALAQ
jgi:uncharacterized repeat protein (TIGR02543 family)